MNDTEIEIQNLLDARKKIDERIRLLRNKVNNTTDFIRHIHLSGGEVMLNPHFYKILEFLYEKNITVYVATNGIHIPDDVLAQLCNKVQHALRAYTPKEQKAAKAAAESYRENPDFDTYEVLTSLGTGEAIVSVLDEKGVPTIVKQCKILPPQSQMGALDDSSRNSEIQGNILYVKYSQELDRESAYEILKKKPN